MDEMNQKHVNDPRRKKLELHLGILGFALRFINLSFEKKKKRRVCVRGLLWSVWLKSKRKQMKNNLLSNRFKLQFVAHFYLARVFKQWNVFFGGGNSLVKIRIVPNHNRSMVFHVFLPKQPCRKVNAIVVGKFQKLQHRCHLFG
uniref:Uncharacterized protein n=1 Tax=Panagrolaimus sp. JU765 TaxID=591449 RepID=A0AC34Q4U4_9BILA